MKLVSNTLSRALLYTVWTVTVGLTLYIIALYNYLLFHTLAEVFCIAVAIGMFMVAWHTRKYSKNAFLLFLATAYLFVGGIDLLHTLAYKGMAIFRADEANLSTQFWVSARFVQAVSFLVATLFIKRAFKPGRMLLTYSAIAFLIVATILWWEVFPVCFVEGEGLTPFKIVSEYVNAAVLALALVVLWKRNALLDRGMFRLLAGAIVATILSGLTFTLYRDVYGFSNLLGHSLKIIAFFLVYRAVVAGVLEKPYGLLFNGIETKNAALQASEKGFRSLFELSGVGQVETDPLSGRFVRVNSRLCEITGNSEAELLKMTCADIVHPQDRQMVVGAVNRALETGMEYNVVYRIVRPDDTVLWVSQTGIAVCDNTGSAERMIGIVADITPQREARQALETQVDKQAGMLVNSAESLVRASEQKEQMQEQITQRQQALEAIHAIASTFGTSLDSVYEQMVISLADILDVPFVAIVLVEHNSRKIASLFERGRIRHDSRFCPDGTICDLVLQSCQVVKVPNLNTENNSAQSCCVKSGLSSYLGIPILSHAATALGALCIMGDTGRNFNNDEVHLAEIFARYVSRELVRVEMEKQLRQAEEMKRLGQLTSGVAHEVRNPLNAILAIIEALFQDIGDVPQYEEYLRHIREQGNRLSVLMNDLLELGRPMRASEMRVVSLGDLASNAVDLWRSSTRHRSYDVRCVVPASAARWCVKVDSAKMQQVLFNLFDNACEHSPTESVVEIRVTAPKGGRGAIAVVDRGKGVPPEHHGSVFDPFFTTRKHGTGLGLSIVKHIVNLHGGEVVLCNNEPPPGATAIVHLPLFKQPVPNAHARKE